MFTDIEGSNRLWTGDPDMMSADLAVHDSVIRASADINGGRVVKHTGDGFFLVFDNPASASACAMEIQLSMVSSGILHNRIRLRIGIHTGEAEERNNDYFGPDVNLAARVMAAGLGGQVLLTARSAHSDLPGDCILKDLGSHSLKDIREPIHLYSLAHPDLTERYAACPKVLAVPGSLPPEQTPFVGREAEMLRISAILSQKDCRLLTLLGPGGAGKTRLSIRTALGISHRFSDGVFFVPLALLESGESAAAAVAESISFTLEGDTDPVSQLQQRLEGCEMLFILDNYEQLTDQADLPARLLESSPGLRIIVTSRERLRLRSEWVFEVPGMQVPDAPDHDYERCDSIQLYRKTALRCSGSEPEPDEMEPVAEICRLLEGSPLAIELAASWSGFLPAEDILEQILTPRSLETTLRDVPRRQSSLEASFMFSWNLLKHEQQRNLCSLTVFRGGFDIKAAGEVCGIDIRDIIALKDRSLLWQLEKSRFGLHGMIRHFASRRTTELVEDPEALTDSHSDYYISLLAGSTEDLVHGDREAAVSRLVRDLDNIRAAWNYSVENRIIDRIESGNRGLATLMGVRSQFREAYTLLKAAVESMEAHADDLLMAGLLTQLGWVGSHVRPLEECIPILQRSVDLFRSAGEPEALAYGLNNFANVLNVRGEDRRAEPLYRESLLISRETEDLFGMAAALNNLGILADHTGELDKAMELYSESVDICRKLRNQHGVSVNLSNLSTVLREKGDMDGSIEMLNEALDIEQKIGDSFNITLIKCNIAVHLIIQGMPEQARELVGTCISCFDAQGQAGGIARGCILLAFICVDQGKLPEARENLYRALELLARYRWFSHFVEAMAVCARYFQAARSMEPACMSAMISVSHGSLPGYLQERVDSVLRETERELEPDIIAHIRKIAPDMNLDDAVAWVIALLKQSD